MMQYRHIPYRNYRMTITVKFSVVEEFVQELAADHGCIEDGIVRVTFNYRQELQIPFVYHMSVLAGFLARGKLVKLQHACGDIMRDSDPPLPQTEATRRKAYTIAQQIEAAAKV